MAKNKAKEFYSLVKEMRRLQKRNEQFHTAATLKDKKAAEEKVDSIIEHTEDILKKKQEPSLNFS